MFAAMLLLGGIAVFLLGLRFIGENTGLALGKKMRSWLSVATGNRFGAILLGTGITAVAQSSVAINMAVISLVDAGVITFFGACAVIVGTNIGTTVTAQLVSLSSSASSVTAIGSAIAFFGFVLSNLKGKKLRFIGDIMIGFGLVFVGIEIITDAVKNFYDEAWFINFFTIKSPPILLLNGFFITAACQSSSIVSGILVILAADNKVDFSSCVFVILGANIGSCAALVVASAKNGVTAKRAAIFNLVFNAFGALVFAPFFFLFRDFFTDLFASSSPLSRAVANFHTFFNVAAALVFAPLLRPLEKLCAFIVKDDEKTNGRTFEKARTFI